MPDPIRQRIQQGRAPRPQRIRRYHLIDEANFTTNPLIRCICGWEEKTRADADEVSRLWDEHRRATGATERLPRNRARILATENLP